MSTVINHNEILDNEQYFFDNTTGRASLVKNETVGLETRRMNFKNSLQSDPKYFIHKDYKRKYVPPHELQPRGGIKVSTLRESRQINTISQSTMDGDTNINS